MHASFVSIRTTALLTPPLLSSARNTTKNDWSAWDCDGVQRNRLPENVAPGGRDVAWYVIGSPSASVALSVRW